jgi:hypothetical protein
VGIRVFKFKIVEKGLSGAFYLILLSLPRCFLSCKLEEPEISAMASNVHGRPIAQPRGSAGRLREGVGGSSASSSTALKAGGGQALKSAEQNFEEQQRQCRAATVLESNEMLIWAGMDLCEVNTYPRFSTLIRGLVVMLMLMVFCVAVESGPDEIPFRTRVVLLATR